MSAWMTGIQTGMDLARQRAAQQQQAQEFAFRQQQAGINNAQQDRAFAQQQQYQDQMRQMREMEYADRKAEIARRLMQDQYDGQIFKAAAQPDMMPGAPGGVGPVQPHPLQTIPDNVILGASPSGRAAYLSSMQRNAGFQQRRQAAQRRIEMARADGTLKYMSDKDLEEFTTLGLLGELAPDEMPMSVRKQQEEQHDQLAQLMAVVRDPQTGELVSDRRTYEQIRGLEPKLAQAMFLHRQQQEAAQEQAIQRQKYALEQITAKAAVRAPAASAGTKTALGALYGRMAKELDKKPEQAYSREKFVLAQAAALMGHSLPDGSVVLNAGQVNPQGFIEVVHPDGSTEGIDPTEFQRRYNTAAEPAPGLLDGPAGPQQQDAQPDEDQVWNRVLEEFQNRNGRGPTQDDADELRQIEQALTGG